MNNWTIAHKEGLRIVGFKTVLGRAEEGIHSPSYSGPKTEFFKGLIQQGQMALLRPLAEGPGFGIVAVADGNVSYFAGVRTSRPAPEQTEEVLLSDSDYLVLTGSGGLSRQAFDKLEDQAFGELLNGGFEWEHSGGPIAEWLVNGNPAAAEVEVWIPVRRRDNG